jgi:hypothetical protein
VQVRQENAGGGDEDCEVLQHGHIQTRKVVRTMQWDDVWRCGQT